MADTTKNILIRVKSETDDAEKGFKSLKSELRDIEKELNRMAMAGEDGTEQFQKMSQRAGELKDQISDTKARINALASDTFKLDAMTGAVEGLASGFAIVEGATALFGAENEDLQKTLVKVQGAMALLQGAQSIQNLLQKESAVYIGAMTIAQKVYNFVVGESTGAIKSFRLAMLSLGIPAIITGIALLVENWDSLTSALGSNKKEIDGIITKNSDLIKSEKEISDNLVKSGGSVKSLVDEYKNSNTTMARRKEIIKELNEISPNYFKNLDAEKNSVDDVTKAYKGFSDALIKQITLEIAKSKLTKISEQLFDLELKRNDLENSRQKLAEKQKQLDSAKMMGNEVLINQLTREINLERDLQKGIESGITTKQKSLEADKQGIMDAVVTAQTELDKLGGDVFAKAPEKIKHVVRQTFDDLDMLSIKSVGTIAHKMTRTLDDFKWFYEQQRALLDTFMDDNSHSFDQMQMQLDTALANRVISQTEYNERVAKLNQLEFESKMETGKAIANVLQAMSDAVGKQTKAGKIMATASALINTYLGISEVLKAKNPYPEPFGTAIKIANASVIGINGFKQVREINKVQIPNQSGGGGNTGSQPSLAGASGSMPNVQSIGSQLSSATKIQLNQFENFKNPTIRAYVVESDVTGTQQRAKRLKQTSTIK
jgi:hypothetical protein